MTVRDSITVCPLALTTVSILFAESSNCLQLCGFFDTIGYNSNAKASEDSLRSWLPRRIDN